MTGLVGGRLLVGGLGPGPPVPLKSGPDTVWPRTTKFARITRVK